MSVFALEADIGRVPQWNVDPGTLIQAPKVSGKTLNYRDESLVGDIKYLWEPNRHLHLVTLAQAYILSNNPTHLETLKAHLTSWFDQCPYPMGPNWCSSLELAIRCINWSIVWQLLGGLESSFVKDDPHFRDTWLKSIYQHAHFIQGYFSRYSSANNHLIGEAAGLFIITTTWPYWDEFKKLQTKAKVILEEECVKQNAPDGVNREQTTSYQQFVLDFLLLSALAGRANGTEFSKAYWQRIEVMLEYLASIMDVAGNMPMIGDADDGYVVKLSQEPDFCPYRSLLATGAVLFDRPDFAVKAGRFDDKSRMLLGEEGESKFQELLKVRSSKFEVRREESREANPENTNYTLPVRRAFPEGGYYILGKDFETEDEVRCIVDCGPLGYLSIAAHGHADALAMYLSVGGEEFLIDPGTYAYHTQKKWRDYFRGTSAHNTVRVDGQDQSVIGGNFMWLKKAKAECEVFESSDVQDRFIGMHDGYKRFKDKVLHRREIVFDKVRNAFVVTDILECKKQHAVERFWHFAEQCEVSVDGRDVIAVNNGVTLRLQGKEDETPELFKGDEELPLGWVSRRFDVKEPITTAVFSSTITGTTRLQTVISIQ